MKYDINGNKVLTADELGAASYATYRLSDYDENGNEISKTGNSMGYDEYSATVAILTGATEPGDPDRKNFTDLQFGAYEMLENYKP